MVHLFLEGSHVGAGEEAGNGSARYIYINEISAYAKRPLPRFIARHEITAGAKSNARIRSRLGINSSKALYE
jgi:hypothetical protein